jgi:uncharacterized protein DUF6882
MLARDIEYRLGHWLDMIGIKRRNSLYFRKNGVAKVTADVQFVGSISTESDTWLWAWANDSVDPQLSTSVQVVRKYGEEHGFNHLTTKKWHAHEVGDWKMTSVSAFLLKARGAYRTPKGAGFTLKIMTDVR